MERIFKRLDTQLIHAGEPEPRIQGAVSMPIFQCAGAITFTSPSSSAPCGTPSSGPASRTGRPATPSAIRSPPTCSRTATISEPSKSSSATAT